MRRVIYGLGCLLLLLGWTSSGMGVVDRIVAIVNQEIITLSEVEMWIDPLQREIQTGDRLEKRERIQELRLKALEKLIEEKLIDQATKKAGIKVTSKEVEATLDDIKQRNAATQEDLEKALAKEGLTLEAFKKQLEKKIQGAKLVNIAMKVETKAGEKELKEFYQKNIDRYRSEESYRPAHILLVIPKEAKSEEIQEIRKRCQDILDKIKKGEDFGELAILYSEDISAKDRGDLGFFKKGELLPAIEKEALRLQVGGVSGMIRTDTGFHIIKLLDRRGGTSIPFEEIKEKVQGDYYEMERQKAYKQFLSTLKEKAIIEIKL